MTIQSSHPRFHEDLGLSVRQIGVLWDEPVYLITNNHNSDHVCISDGAGSSLAVFNLMAAAPQLLHALQVFAERDCEAGYGVPCLNFTDGRPWCPTCRAHEAVQQALKGK